MTILVKCIISIILLGLLFISIKNAFDMKKLLNRTFSQDQILFDDLFDKIKVPCIPVKHINHKQVEDCVLMVDTGANTNFIREDILQECFPEYKKELEYDSDIMTVNGSMEMNKSLVLPIHINGKKFKDRFIVIANNQNFSYISDEGKVNVVGIIGSEFMNKNGFKIDMKNLNLSIG